MSCPGLHCPGCSGGQSLGIVAAAAVGLVAAAEMVQWVAARIWWIGGTLAVSFALAVAAAMALQAWTDRRTARFAAAHGIVSRADVIQAGPVRAAVAEPTRRELEPRAIHLHIHAADPAGAAAIVRTALPGAITEGR